MDDVKLRTAAATHRVALVAGAGCGNCSAPVVVRGDYLRWDCVARATCAETVAGFGGFGFGVAGLNHKALNDPVEQYSVVEALFHEFLEIVGVYGGVIKEFHLDVAHCGF